MDHEYPKKFEQPFDYAKKYHATERVVDGKNFISVVGAPEKIIDMCSFVWGENELTALDKEKRQALEEVFYRFAKDGLRVVACAVKQKSNKKSGN